MDGHGAATFGRFAEAAPKPCAAFRELARVFTIAPPCLYPWPKRCPYIPVRRPRHREDPNGVALTSTQRGDLLLPGTDDSDSD